MAGGKQIHYLLVELYFYAPATKWGGAYSFALVRP